MPPLGEALRARVVRDGADRIVPAAQLVREDLVRLRFLAVNHDRIRTGHAARVIGSPRRTRPMIASCAAFWADWTIRVGNSRRTVFHAFFLVTILFAEFLRQGLGNLFQGQHRIFYLPPAWPPGARQHARTSAGPRGKSQQAPWGSISSA